MSTPHDDWDDPTTVETTPTPGALEPPSVSSPIEAIELDTGIITYPLHPVDPPKIGDFWPTERLLATASGVAYLAYEDNADNPVMIVMLSQGAADDPAARDRLAGEVDRMDIDTVIARGGLDQDTGRMGDKYRCEDDDPHAVDGSALSPWVALGFDQSTRAVREAHRILAEVDLSSQAPQGEVAGPNYRLHWADRFAPGESRVWPLPWPGRRDRGGWVSLLAAWLLMLLLAAVAILIAILIFSQAPETSPPPPIPSQEDSGGGSGDPSESESGGGPDPSPSDSESGGGGSPSPSDSESGGGSPSPGDSESGGGGSPGGDETAWGGGPSTPSRV